MYERTRCADVGKRELPEAPGATTSIANVTALRALSARLSWFELLLPRDCNVALSTDVAPRCLAIHSQLTQHLPLVHTLDSAHVASLSAHYRLVRAYRVGPACVGGDEGRISLLVGALVGKNREDVPPPA